MPIEKRKWFDVRDSLVKRENGEGTFCNVEARFSDHPVLNLAKSKEVRRNVYDLSIVLHTRVKRAMGDLPAVKNMSAHVLRFDKGKAAIDKTDFETYKASIVRCWDAWKDYQLHRQAAVTDMETWALKQINEMPLPGKVLVNVGGQLVEYDTVDPDEAEEDDDDEQAVVTAPELVASQNGAVKAAA